MLFLLQGTRLTGVAGAELAFFPDESFRTFFSSCPPAAGILGDTVGVAWLLFFLSALFSADSAARPPLPARPGDTPEVSSAGEEGGSALDSRTIGYFSTTSLGEVAGLRRARLRYLVTTDDDRLVLGLCSGDRITAATAEWAILTEMVSWPVVAAAGLVWGDRTGGDRASSLSEEAQLGEALAAEGAANAAVSSGRAAAAFLEAAADGCLRSLAITFVEDFVLLPLGISEEVIRRRPLGSPG